MLKVVEMSPIAWEVWKMAEGVPVLVETWKLLGPKSCPPLIVKTEA
jgi:hypothetical protein